MTTKELAAKPQTMRFKLKSVDQGVKPDGTASYSVSAYAPFREGFSQYPTQMFLYGHAPEVEASEVYGALKTLDAGAVLSLRITPGKLKAGKDGVPKPDNGEFGNYYWNVVDLAGEPTQAQGRPQEAQEAPSEPEEALFPGEGPSSVRPANWESTQVRIGVSWAIDQARQTLLHFSKERPADADWGPFLKEVSVLAPRFIGLRDYLVAKAGEPKRAAKKE